MDRPELPAPQYVDAEYVLDVMGREGDARIRGMGPLQIVVLGVVAGGFITMGALFSVLLGAGVDAPGPQRLLEGLGFSAGFFFVILSGAALFTEANVTLPAARAWGEERGMVKVVAEEGTGRLLGAHVLAYHGADLIHPIAVAMQAGDGGGAPIARAFHVHPTLGEVVKSAVERSQPG